MKIKYTYLLVLISNMLSAQSVFTADDMPKQGMSYFVAVDTNKLSPGNPGTNQTWDFSRLKSLADTVAYSYLSPGYIQLLR